MTSLPVKSIGTVLSGATTSGAAMTSQAANRASFENVWNQRTEKNVSAEPASESERTMPKEKAIVKNSLKSKDSYKRTVSQEKSEDEKSTDELKSMTPEEWNRAMEVLGTAAVEMVQELADAFGITVEEVQSLMKDLGMEQLDVLRQDTLGQLILAAGGEQETASLLTNEELYQQYQTLMEQLNGLLENVEEAVQTDATQLVQMAAGNNADETPFIEVTVEEEAKASMETASTQTDETNIGDTENAVINADDAEKADTQMQKQDEDQSLDEGEENSDANRSDVANQGTGESFVLQNQRTASFEPQLQQLSQTASSWDADTMNIMRQIMDYMKIQVKPDMSELQMQLHPANLGTLQVHVASKSGAVTAQFITQNETVKAALESQMIQLKESFAEQGVKVDAIEVTVQTHQFEENLEHGRGRQQNEPERRSRSRRIQLDEVFTMGDMSAMDEEEQLAAQMMAANGNTVDYTA